ncbi:fatty acyl-AMP ligase [Amycolatopsis nigrescens]|uniref:fatty acyl-AMP ligase n=1 Tax=Amycolatopsis nigrescens TaxID=381445 RepID=UPI00037655B3|nr:fatty acyl-AMP ligase [Amycolatopsis nigrescens]
MNAIPGPDSAGESFATLLHHWARQLADETALTFLDYSESVDAKAVYLTWSELDERVSAVAARLLESAAPGERAAIVADQSADYVVAFLGAIRAGMIAVPLFSPGLPGHAERLATVLADAEPSLLLTTAGKVGEVTAFVASQAMRAPDVIAVDTAEPVRGEHEWPVPAPDDLAYLQYTSGSTRTPAGVMLAHRNVLANARQACRAYGAEPGLNTTVSWLPLYHDLGLMLGIGAPMAGGIGSVLMDPLAFLGRPGRWLRALSLSPGAISAGPNFAFAYTASRVPEAEKVYLELGGVSALTNGSEPVLPATIARFQDAFAECGLPPNVQRVCYGLAEATLVVSVTDADKPLRQVTFDRDRLAAGTAVPVVGGEGATTLVSCGRPAGQELLIVDPATRRPLPAGEVGEIWVSGPNIGAGYWKKPDDSVATFGLSPAVAAGEEPGRGMDGRGWLATGDLGLLFEGELYMTGRSKDLIIVDGRNHYPQDIEQTVEGNPAVRPHSAGAFAVAGEEGEKAVVVLERSKRDDASELDLGEAGAAIRAEVSRLHGLGLHDIVFVPPGEVPRTSSGKISRALCRSRYLDGTFTGRRLS